MNLKTRIYEALFGLNRDFQQVAETIAKLRELKIMPDHFIRARIHRVEELRADTNRYLTILLHGIEGQEASRFGRMARADEESGQPASDVPALVSDELMQVSK